MAVVLVHGAGSTCAAARRLLGLAQSEGIVPVEDRTGHVEGVIAQLDTVVDDVGPRAVIVGVSLGAHAVARWAARRARAGAPAVAGLVCVLPAWTGTPGMAAAATAQAGREIAGRGITATLEELGRRPQSADVLSLLRLAWAEYSDATLAQALLAASRGRGPEVAELRSIREPVGLIGWEHDALHPAAVTRTWGRHLPGSRVALAARPESRLLQAALATLTGSGPAGSMAPATATASGAPPPRAWPHLHG